MPVLSYNDKKQLLASSLKISNYDIKDFTDDVVIYYDPQNSKMWGRKYAAKDGKVTFETAQPYMTRTVYEPITTLGTFSMNDVAVEFAGDEVLLTGKLFEAGDYPDKQFSINEAELASAAAEFCPVDNDLEHKPTILSGKLGQVRSVVAKGKELLGTVAIPKWLYDASDNKPISTSLAWNRSTKRIVANALVLNPRVPDAQLVAAFNAADSHKEGIDMPIQMNKKPSWWDKLCAAFSAKALPEGFEDFDPAQATFTEEPPAGDSKPEPTAPAPTSKQADTEPAKPDQAQMSRMSGLESRLLSKEAAEFADNQIKGGKAFPAQRDQIIAMFTQAAKDDSAGAGVACFSEDGTLAQGGRLKALAAMFEAAPAHKLFTEQIPGAEELGVIFSSGDSAGSGGSKPNALEATALGKKAAQMKKAKEGK